MAIVVVFRVAIVLTPIAYRVVSSSGPGDANRVANTLANFWSRISDADEDPAELSVAMSEAEGEVFYVTDFTGTFELRKLAWRISRAPTGGTVEDVAVMTFHFLKVSGGTPAAWVDGTDLPAIEALFTTYWGTMKPYYAPHYHSDQYRWYKDGPAFYELRETPAPARYVPIAAGNPAVRVTEVDVAGTGSTTANLPPQCAMTITEKTSARAHWGRFYLPAPQNAQSDGQGRIGAWVTTDFLPAAVTLYNGCRSAGYKPVAWSIQKPERAKKSGALLPAQEAIAYEVTSLQMDNLFDVIRSRRWGAPTVKAATALT